ncbi:hypothetical protein LEP1GSC060_0647 [Leptospira weilii serovar Ranarum str. ICFT]|uniref:Uncharacterized protein n=1 Tax=Leptospira weilii serovar Ranarum str. ICFT TaxID=1218598 RepID=N1WMH9_9LEPT|nr:hypothetical protein [Leptospira weilii]EMY78369.1 hypothetical protein LEP1GSC060_0647 [Leptospira weilii serovar Ranarum str. ICFT]
MWGIRYQTGKDSKKIQELFKLESICRNDERSVVREYDLVLKSPASGNVIFGLKAFSAGT